jgi:hypothetical protein
MTLVVGFYEYVLDVPGDVMKGCANAAALSNVVVFLALGQAAE